MCECRLCLGPARRPGGQQTAEASQRNECRFVEPREGGAAIIPVKLARCESASGRPALIGAVDASLRRLAWGLVRLYQLFLSPLLGPGCRFEPSCSRYAQQALEQHGFARALGLISWRLLRCNPWGGQGWDPVPNRAIAESIASESAHSFGKFSFEAALMVPCVALRGGAASAVSEG